MKISKIQKSLVLGVALAMAFLAGCELIVDFDRTQIPVETVDAALPDGAIVIPDGGTANDAATDAPNDAASDAPTDAPDDGG